MAGIGFELRKLFQEQGLINNVKAYAYSSLTTIGPMVLCMFLIIALQRMMSFYDGSYIEWELYIATVTYCFIFSIVITSGISMVLTRFIADMIFEKKYKTLLSSFYGSLIIILPIGALIAWLFLRNVSADIGYKAATYLFFMELIMIWMQGIYLSALKDYMRIVRSFAIGVVVSLISGYLLFAFAALQSTTSALLAIDIGFFVIVLLSLQHFEHIFPRAESRYYFTFLSYFKKYPSLFFTGSFVYGGIYLHSFIYWLGPKGIHVADRYLVMPTYDLPVFYAFISVVPTLVMFVVSVETAFYEKFRTYYLNVLDGGTYQEINKAKKEMQKTLLREVSFLMEVQLLFTILSIAIGMKMLPRIGFTMAQLDLFNILVLGYFLFIMMFVLLHILMYFDDRKGVFMISSAFIVANALLTYWMMHQENDGMGMFLAAVIALGAAIMRLIYVLRNIDYFTFCSQPLTTQKQYAVVKPKIAKPGAIVSIIVLMTVVLSACTSEPSTNAAPAANEETVTAAVETESLSEDKRIYERDEDGSVKTLYVTILPEHAGVENPVTWYGLNRITDRYSEENLEAIVQEGALDGSGPEQGMFGYGTELANAKISLRGNTARYSSQKSYKLKLFDEAGVWQDQRTINLNKHSSELSRLRNKLSFDLLESIPNLTSLRTQFVRMYVKDLSEGATAAKYEDYGLYTHIEQPNELFLKSHWLDPYGNLYKAAMFEFLRYPDEIKSQSDPEYDKDAFEQVLEIKGREDHDKLIKMLDDLNNKQLSIDSVVEEHFDADNFLTWTAVNLLMDNMDTNSQNYYLYSPLNSEKWYFLPWDYDAAFEQEREEGEEWQYRGGLSTYWVNTLHNRYFRSEEHVQQLTDKMEELSKVINRDTIKKQLDIYRNSVEPFLFRAPDMNYLPGLNTDFDKELEKIMSTPEKAMQRYLDDLEKPKPFYLNDAELNGTKTLLSWDIAYDLQGDDLLYEVVVARDPAMTDIVANKKDLQLNRVTLDNLSAGIYYWRVIVRDSKGNDQAGFDYFEDFEGTKHYGVREFEVY